MNRDNTYTGSVCDDCLFLLANGDVPSGWSEDQITEWLAAIEEELARVEHVTLGHFHTEECGEDPDGECERLGFSTSACDHCGSKLHGDRHAAVFWLTEES